MATRAAGIFRSGRFDVHYRIYSAEKTERTPIICVNGAQQTMAAWKGFVSHFSDNCPVVLFDLPGQGRSTFHDGPSHVSLREQTAVLASLVDRIAPGGSVCVFGASWGSAVAASYAASYPDRVEKLILASFCLSANEAMQEAIRRAQEAIENGEYAMCGSIIIEAFAERVPPAMQRQITEQFKTIDPASIATFYDHITWTMSARMEEEIAFSRIAADTLVVNGTGDPIINASSLALLEETIPRCKRLLIENAGHFLHFEQLSIVEQYADFLFETV